MIKCTFEKTFSLSVSSCFVQIFQCIGKNYEFCSFADFASFFIAKMPIIGGHVPKKIDVFW